MISEFKLHRTAHGDLVEVTDGGYLHLVRAGEVFTCGCRDYRAGERCPHLDPARRFYEELMLTPEQLVKDGKVERLDHGEVFVETTKEGNGYTVRRRERNGALAKRETFYVCDCSSSTEQSAPEKFCLHVRAARLWAKSTMSSGGSQSPVAASEGAGVGQGTSDPLITEPDPLSASRRASEEEVEEDFGHTPDPNEVDPVRRELWRTAEETISVRNVLVEIRDQLRDRQKRDEDYFDGFLNVLYGIVHELKRQNRHAGAPEIYEWAEKHLESEIPWCEPCRSYHDPSAPGCVACASPPEDDRMDPTADRAKAADLGNLLGPKQIGLIRGLCKDLGFDPDEFVEGFEPRLSIVEETREPVWGDPYGCRHIELTKAAASAVIRRLRESKAGVTRTNTENPAEAEG